ncbi:MAG TPA: SUMF1/EgtB/PvdO family nonheme iron enzyme [Pirellulales bacterium]|jgi:formylglycine-generating enzyme required for sulfatase activity/serine/threonine protein kinase/Leucine-rich repeat (LRR) protein|nr:SUMF1/EgtB/PvdO family nonheme iron enzyme [Pirellulales bacterium]
MAVALETVVKQLEDSGIVAAGKLENFVPPKAHPKDVAELVAELVKQNHLTRFQAQQVAAGKVKALILGEYTILDKIGAGGMGQVFKALHRRMDRTVAIKMLPPAMTKDAAAVARFEREVRAAAKLSHPNIVAAYDAGQANGVHFLVMEYVEGSDLSALVKKNGAFPVAKAINYVLQAARGLEFAHKKGVVHRDIKPANLLLDGDGTVKILDMGLARIDAAGGVAAQAELTGTGAVMGTVDYMAPEQGMSTKHADARADIYSLGCSLYYLVAGKPTYDGETVAAKLVAHHTHPIPDLRAAQPEVPEQLEAVFKKMVAKKIDDRYQTVSDVVADLEKCQAALHASATPETSVWKSAPTNEPSDLSILMTSRPLRSLSMEDEFRIEPIRSTPLSPRGRGAGGEGAPPWRNTKVLAAAGAAWFFVLVLGVIVVIRNQKGEEVGRLELPPGHTADVHVRPAKDDAEPMFPSTYGPAKPVATIDNPAFQAWMRTVAAMPADKQVQAVAKKLVELNPGFDGNVNGFDGKLAPTIEAGVVTGFGFSSQHVTDIAPVRALTGLKALRCGGNSTASGILSDLSPLQGMKLEYLSVGLTRVSDLTPLRGMPLTTLNCAYLSSLTDLSPLRGMPLTILSCLGTQVSDLSPLQGMPLREIAISPKNITKGMDALRQITSLKTIQTTGDSKDRLAAAEFWKRYDAGEFGKPAAPAKLAYLDPAFQQWMKTVAALSAEKQIEAVSKKLQELNPSLDGSKIHRIEKGEVVEFSVKTGGINDISPIRALTKLRKLGCSGGNVDDNITGSFSDLSPLQGMPLNFLYCGRSKVSDLSPLKGMPLIELNCNFTLISDLSPLEGMPLEDLTIIQTEVSDLSPLENCKRLKGLAITKTKVTATGVAALQKALPNCKIDWDGAERGRGAGGEGLLKAAATGSASAGFALDFSPERQSYVEVPDWKYDGRTPLTVEAWVTPRIVNRSYSVISSQAGGGFGLKGSTASLWTFTMHGTEAYEPALAHKASAASVLTHVAGVFDGKELIVFVDGHRQKSTRTVTLPIKPPGQLTNIGAAPGASAAGVFDGTIDEVRISSVARYTSDFTPQQRFEPDAATEVLYHFDEGSGTVAKDSSPHHRDGKISGATWVAAASVGGSQPPADARVFAGKSYQVFKEVLSWHEAQANCVALGGHLAVVNSADENQFIADLMKSGGVNEAWLGATDEKKEGRWIWVDGTAMQYSNWDKGQPNNSVGGRPEHYLAISNATSGKWWDYPADNYRKPGFVCQWDTSPNAAAPPMANAPFDAAQAKAHQAAWAKYLDTQVETTNSVGMRMTLIPPGEFLMGSTPEQLAEWRPSGEREKKPSTDAFVSWLLAEMPQHKVTIRQPYLIGSTEVTVAQFRKFVEASKYVTEAEQYGFGNSHEREIEKAKETDKGKNWKNPGYSITSDTAVTQITWNDAVAFCEWLSQQESGRREPPDAIAGLTASARYRLPTEAEWEYACRAGTTTQYSFGDDKTQLEQYSPRLPRARGDQPVASKLPNPFGLFDMHGNVYECCQDWYDGKWYEKSSPIDPHGPASGSQRVIRSGSWYYLDSHCRSAARLSSPPSNRNFHHGFRIVRPLDATQPAAGSGQQAVRRWETPEFQKWVADTQTLPAEQQIEAVSKKLMELNPGFDGQVTGFQGKGPPKIEKGQVTELQLLTDKVVDISPLSVFKGLSRLNAHGSGVASKCVFSDLSPLEGMPLTQLICGSTQVADLSPLDGMKLTLLSCFHTEVSDLSPLKGMQVTRLDCQGTKVSDLSPLEGTNLDYLLFTPEDITRGMNVIRQMKSLKTIGIDSQKRFPTDEFWKRYDAGEFGKPAAPAKLAYLDPAFPAWVKATQALPAEQQVEAVSKKLMELNPGFDGKITGADGTGTPKTVQRRVTSFAFLSDNVTDISPVRALVGLKALVCAGSRTGKGKLSDLSPVQGMQLLNLKCTNLEVSDLSPLQGMPLDTLWCYDTQVTDLSPLQGSPLSYLYCDNTEVSDLSPLENCKRLKGLAITKTKVTATGVAALQKALPNCKIEWDGATK